VRWSINSSIEEMGHSNELLVIPAQKITFGGLCSKSTMKCRFSFAQNTTFVVMGTVINCAHVGKESLLGGCGVRESVEQYVTCVMVSIHVNVQQCICHRDFGELFRAVSICICVLNVNYEVFQHCTKQCSAVCIFTFFRAILEKT
jgi:hypothetical protein